MARRPSQRRFSSHVYGSVRISSNRRARFRSMFIWTRSSWRSAFFPESPPPALPPPAPSHTPFPSTDSESSASASLSGKLTIVPLLPPCLQMLFSGGEPVCVPAAWISRCRTSISVLISCCVYVDGWICSAACSRRVQSQHAQVAPAKGFGGYLENQ